MDADARGFVAGLGKCFRELRDPRVQGRCDLRRPRIGGHRREIGLRRLCRGVNGFVLVR